MTIAREFEPQSDFGRTRAAASAIRARNHDGFFVEAQNDVGNQAMQGLLRPGLLQAKLRIGDVDDPAEREAEATSQVMEASAVDEGFARGGERHAVVHRRGLTASGPANVPGIVERVLRSGGQPLDVGVRAFFEPRFGRDLGDVRVHTETEAAASARSINAQAYTAGSHIVFDSGMYSPESGHGRRLLAHELTHVMQQGSGVESATAAMRERRGPVIQRKPAQPTAQAEPKEIQDTAKDEALWRGRVDAAVRKFFGLSGSGLTSSNVKFLDFPDFAKKFPSGDLVEDLLYIFIYNGDDFDSLAGQVLEMTAGIPWYLGYPDEQDMEWMRNIIRKAIKRGFFEGRHFPVFDGQPPPFKITPQELVASYIGGITEIGGPRPSHHITMRVVDRMSEVSTLVHEACHFYISEAYRNAARARKDGSEFIGGAMISKILFEGFAEYFAREVVDANAASFGPGFKAYPSEYAQVTRLVETLGEQTVREAYFKGAAGEIKKLMAVVDKYKLTNPDLLIP
jgi:hypothetical protein